MVGVESRGTSVERLKGRETVGDGARPYPVDKRGLVVLDGGTLLMTFKVKQSPVTHCYAVMRLSIWRAAGGNVEGIF